MKKSQLRRFAPAALVALLLSQSALLGHAALDEHHEAEHCQLCAASDRIDDAVAGTDAAVPLAAFGSSHFLTDDVSGLLSRRYSIPTARSPPVS